MLSLEYNHDYIKCTIHILVNGCIPQCQLDSILPFFNKTNRESIYMYNVYIICMCDEVSCRDDVKRLNKTKIGMYLKIPRSTEK